MKSADVFSTVYGESACWEQDWSALMQRLPHGHVETAAESMQEKCQREWFGATLHQDDHYTLRVNRAVQQEDGTSRTSTFRSSKL